MRTCLCGVEETLEKLFYGRSAYCRKCYYARRKHDKVRRRQNPITRKHDRDHTSRYRQLPEKRATIICIDARNGDKRNGRANDMTVEYVKKAIQSPCFYCAGTDIKMTMDRIDNTKGHTLGNVLPACIRCNYLRRDMPFGAWMAIVPTIRGVREKGLFGNWTGGVHRVKI